jgi:serine/threonine protein phosphatase PrpC
MEADAGNEQVGLFVVCDGVGGLALGELASAAVCSAFSTWFQTEFPELLRIGLTTQIIKQSWNSLIQNINQRVLDYSANHHVSLGTTVVALLLVRNTYYIVNIGDSRVYHFSESMYQLTTDQTVTQREVDAGLLKPEAALTDRRRNVLLQCIGTGIEVKPEFTIGTFAPETLFMLCSDGYRHMITPEEFWNNLNPQVVQTEQQIYDSIVHLAELNKYRREEDNISVIAVRMQ